MATDTTVSPRWQKTFDKIEAGQKHTISLANFLGFGFGPLYYFYLRMFRKGLLVLVGLGIGSAILSAMHLVFGTPELDTLQGVAVSAFCASQVTYDYYKFKKFNETIWPALKPIEHPGAIAALLVVLLVINAALTVVDDTENEKKTSDAATSTAIAQATPSKDASSTDATPSSATTEPTKEEESDLQFKRDLAAKHCKAWLESEFQLPTTDQYDPSVRYSYNVIFIGGDLVRNSVLFGGRSFMAYNAQLEKYVDGMLRDREDIPYHICVIDDRAAVINMAIDMKDGEP